MILSKILVTYAALSTILHTVQLVNWVSLKKTDSLPAVVVLFQATTLPNNSNND